MARSKKYPRRMISLLVFAAAVGTSLYLYGGRFKTANEVASRKESVPEIRIVKLLPAKMPGTPEVNLGKPHKFGHSEKENSEREDSGKEQPNADSQGERSPLASAVNYPPYASRDEVALHFSSYEALRTFLKKARERGVNVLGVLGELNTIRLGLPGTYEDQEILALAGDDVEVDFNYAILLPTPPREETLVGNEPFQNGALSWLGVPENNANWGEGVTVAVIDSQVSEHQTFTDSSITRLRLVDSPAEADPNNHGTSVASIIVGADENAPGIAPAAEVLSIEAIGSNGAGNTFTLAQGIVEAVDRGAAIISMSLGTSVDSRVLRNAIQYARDKDVIVVAAAGNESSGVLPYPARYEEVVAVTSVDARGRPAGFINTSEFVDIAAPGVGVQSAFGEDQYTLASGTSISTPFVAGAMAAVRSMEPELSSVEVVSLVLSYTNDAGLPGQDPQLGSGILNLDRIMNRHDRGIIDAAIADHSIDFARQQDGRLPLFVSVQNRGTELLRQLSLDVKVGRQSRSFQLEPLEVGAVTSREFYVTASELAAQGVLVQSVVSTSGDDFETNNLKSTMFRMADSPR